MDLPEGVEPPKKSNIVKSSEIIKVVRYPSRPADPL